VAISSLSGWQRFNCAVVTNDDSQFVHASRAGAAQIERMDNDNPRTEHLLAWQWRLYDNAHRDRANLAVHLTTVPLFLAGTVAVVLAPAVRPWLAAVGIAAMGAAIALQGRGHHREENAPSPFRGPRDAVARIFLEQWITFPRFVWSGGFARAWRAAR
jgi:hypothetical protein